MAHAVGVTLTGCGSFPQQGRGEVDGALPVNRALHGGSWELPSQAGLTDQKVAPTLKWNRGGGKLGTFCKRGSLVGNHRSHQILCI